MKTQYRVEETAMDATITDENPQIAPQDAPQVEAQAAPHDDTHAQLEAIRHDLQELKTATHMILARLPAPQPSDADDEASRKRRALREQYLRPWTPDELAAQHEAMAQLSAMMAQPLSNGMTNDEFAALYMEICEAERGA